MLLFNQRVYKGASGVLLPRILFSYNMLISSSVIAPVFTCQGPIGIDRRSSLQDFYIRIPSKYIPTYNIHAFICLMRGVTLQYFAAGGSIENRYDLFACQLLQSSEWLSKVLMGQMLRSCEDDFLSIPVRSWKV